MKIAIVAPSPVPFGIGGAEKLWLGMLEFINRYTTHQCELIKIPVKEDSFWNLIEAYYKFYTLDVSSFDMVITGKYPAWMVQHENHHIYMLHCLRGFYDCSHLLGLEDRVKTKNKKVQNILNKLKKSSTTTNKIFELLFDLKHDKTIDKNLFNFPGVFIKELVHFFDTKAMKNIKRFSAISKTVANRKEYFPHQCKVNINYPPSTLHSFKNSSYEYFFTVSRLDDAKRIDMIIDAYQKTDTNIPLKIAGTGPLLENFKKLTKDDSRIELLGFISDTELVQYYANSYAIFFTPYDEDYGLVTIEAMMSEKAVLTFTDAGGVVEFVEDRVTGLVCKPNVSDLTKNIKFLSNNIELCKQMGKNAKKRVENITWKNTISNLLNEPSEETIKSTDKQKKVTVVTVYSVYPPRNGGQNRVFYLYKELAKTMKVEIVCLVKDSEKYEKIEISSNLFEIRVPKTKEHSHKEWEIEKKAGIPITDIAMLYLSSETPLFKEAIKNSFKTSDYLIAIQPYTYELCKSITSDFIHDSQNVEYNLKKQMLKNTPYNQKLLKDLFEVEKKSVQETQFTTVCAHEDALTFEDIYGFDLKKTILVANGVDLESVPYTSYEKRKKLKQEIYIENHKIVLFIGSWHQPNIEAVKAIFDIAKKLPQYNFIIVGSVGDYFSPSAKPINVGFTGVIDDEEKEIYLSIADVAINPMLNGSGTNLKMLDYMANGIPVISTKIGARGLNIPNGYVVICDIEEFDKHIVNIEQLVNVEQSRRYVEINYSWEVIHKHLKKALEYENI